MKKCLLVLLVLVLSLSLFSCSDVYEEIIISDVREYDDIWSLSERRANETSILFPNSINEEDCVDFVCEHTTYQLLGTGWQTLLRVKYDDSSFSSEINRLNNLCENLSMFEYSKYFDNPVYITVWNWNTCFEYAVIDENEKSVCYIYLQLIEKKDLFIDEKYIPVGYEMQLTNSKSYSVYEE